MLYNDDCINVMQKIKNESVDVVFADPPYFLSNGGKSIASGKVVSVNKGEWDKKENYGELLRRDPTYNRSDMHVESQRYEEGCEA